MITLATNLEQKERFVLAENPRVTRGEGRSPLHLDSWIEIAQPAVIPLTETLIGSDEELRAFWATEQNRYRYDYVSLSCCFGPAETTIFTKAWMEVELICQDGEEKPVAWSMAPHEIIDSAKLTHTDKLGAEFKLLSGEVQQQVERSYKEWFLRAFRERSAQPYWEFRHTIQSPIAGSWNLALVVRSPVGVESSGKLSLRAVVEKRTFLLFRKNHSFEEPASILFKIAPQS